MTSDTGGKPRVCGVLAEDSILRRESSKSILIMVSNFVES